MKDLLDKLSSYNLFNYLLPGTLFVAAAERIAPYRFGQRNLVVELFVYYFIGLVISRIGSLLVEPMLRVTKFVTFAPYQDFIRACRVDAKIEVLSEQNNMFRTLCALFVCLLAFRAADAAVSWFGLDPQRLLLSGFIGLFVLFAFAYRKQTQFVAKRVKAGVDERR